MWDFWAVWLRNRNSDTPRTASRWRASDLAVQVPSKDKNTPPDYIPIVCWQEQAEFVSRYLTKGRQIVVEGRLSTRKYTGSDNKNHKVVEVKASRICFADSGQGGGGDYGSNIS